jgi:hypothetical protein
MSVIGKRENALVKGCNLAQKAHSAEYAKGTRLTRPAKEAVACGGGMGWLGGLGRLGRTPRRIKWEFDVEFQLNLDFGMTFRNSTRRFRRNFDMKIFPKFF